jgi:hypothetical protein
MPTGALGGAEEAHRRWPGGRSEQGFLLGERYSSERREQGKGWACSHWQDSRGNAPLPQKNDFVIHDFAKPAQN